MKEYEECPICGCMHDGADEVCEDCVKRINKAVRQIQDARDAMVEDMIYEFAGGNEVLANIIREGL